MGEDIELLSRSEAVTAFIADPLLPEPGKLIMGHISALMALASAEEGPIYKQAVKLLSMEHDISTATHIWETWAPYIAPPGRTLVGWGRSCQGSYCGSTL